MAPNLRPTLSTRIRSSFDSKQSKPNIQKHQQTSTFVVQDTAVLRDAIGQAINNDSFQNAIAAHLAKLIEPSIREALDTIQPVVETVYQHDVLLRKTNRSVEDLLQRFDTRAEDDDDGQLQDTQTRDSKRNDEAEAIKQALDEHNTHNDARHLELSNAIREGHGTIFRMVADIAEMKAALSLSSQSLSSLKSTAQQSTTDNFKLQEQLEELKIDMSRVMKSMETQSSTLIRIKEADLATAEILGAVQQSHASHTLALNEIRAQDQSFKSASIPIFEKTHADTAKAFQSLTSNLTSLKDNIKAGIAFETETISALEAKVDTVISSIDSISSNDAQQEVLVGVRNSKDFHTAHRIALENIKSAVTELNESHASHVAALRALQPANEKTSQHTASQSKSLEALETQMGTVIATLGSQSIVHSDIRDAVHASNEAHTSHSASLLDIKDSVRAAHDAHVSHARALEVLKTASDEAAESTATQARSFTSLESQLGSIRANIDSQHSVHTEVRDAVQASELSHSTALNDIMTAHVTTAAQIATQTTALDTMGTQLGDIATTLNQHSSTHSEIKDSLRVANDAHASHTAAFANMEAAHRDILDGIGTSRDLAGSHGEFLSSNRVLLENTNDTHARNHEDVVSHVSALRDSVETHKFAVESLHAETFQSYEQTKGSIETLSDSVHLNEKGIGQLKDQILWMELQNGRITESKNVELVSTRVEATEPHPLMIEKSALGLSMAAVAGGGLTVLAEKEGHLGKEHDDANQVSVSGSSVEEPSTKEVLDEGESAPGTEPVQQTNNAKESRLEEGEPVVEHELTEEPVTEDPVTHDLAEPVYNERIPEEPVDEEPAAEPAIEATIHNEPVAETFAVEPSAEAPVKEPMYEKPVVERLIHGESVPEELTREEPAIDPVHGDLVQDRVAAEPAAESGGELAVELATEPATERVAEEMPQEESATERVTEEIPELPLEEPGTKELVHEDLAVEEPATEQMHDDSTLEPVHEEPVYGEPVHEGRIYDTELSNGIKSTGDELAANTRSTKDMHPQQSDPETRLPDDIKEPINKGDPSAVPSLNHLKSAGALEQLQETALGADDDITDGEKPLHEKELVREDSAAGKEITHQDDTGAETKPFSEIESEMEDSATANPVTDGAAVDEPNTTNRDILTQLTAEEQAVEEPHEEAKDLTRELLVEDSKATESVVDGSTTHDPVVPESASKKPVEEAPADAIDIVRELPIEHSKAMESAMDQSTAHEPFVSESALKVAEVEDKDIDEPAERPVVERLSVEIRAGAEGLAAEDKPIEEPSAIENLGEINSAREDPFLETKASPIGIQESKDFDIAAKDGLAENESGEEKHISKVEIEQGENLPTENKHLSQEVSAEHLLAEEQIVRASAEGSITDQEAAKGPATTAKATAKEHTAVEPDVDDLESVNDPENKAPNINPDREDKDLKGNEPSLVPESILEETSATIPSHLEMVTDPVDHGTGSESVAEIAHAQYDVHAPTIEAFPEANVEATGKTEAETVLHEPSAEPPTKDHSAEPNKSAPASSFSKLTQMVGTLFHTTSASEDTRGENLVVEEPSMPPHAGKELHVETEPGIKEQHTRVDSGIEIQSPTKEPLSVLEPVVEIKPAAEIGGGQQDEAA